MASARAFDAAADGVRREGDDDERLLVVAQTAVEAAIGVLLGFDRCANRAKACRELACT